MDCCNRCLVHDPDNINVQALQKKVLKSKETKDRKFAERQEQVRKQQEQERKIRDAFQVNAL